MASSCGRLVLISRTGPAASDWAGCMLCGSHLIHCQYRIFSRDAQTQMRRSSGEWNTASWATAARSMG